MNPFTGFPYFSSFRWLPLLLVAFLVGCSSKPRVVTDYDSGYGFAQLKTFSLAEARQQEREDVLISPFTFQHVERIVQQEMAKSYTQVAADADPDFIVHYHIVIEEKLDPGSYDRIYGYGYYSRFYRYHPSPLFYGSTGGPRVYNQGNLIIDLVDARTQKPIWRGVSEKRLRTSATPAQQREILTTAVREVLAQFPPVNP